MLITQTRKKPERSSYVCSLALGDKQTPVGLFRFKVCYDDQLSCAGPAEQIPRGLEGDEDMDGDMDGVKFERRRERERRRNEKGGKRKGVKAKDREWILKKKEVCPLQPY